MAHHDDATENLRIKSTDADTEGNRFKTYGTDADAPTMEPDEAFKWRGVSEPAPHEAEGHAVRRGAAEDQPMGSDEAFRYGRATDDADTEGSRYKTYADAPTMEPDEGFKWRGVSEPAPDDPSMEPDEAFRWRP